MDNAKKEIEAKLTLAKDKLLKSEEELLRLESLISPLVKQRANAQQEERYLRTRVEKLAEILAKL
jgi:hypothetical protein